MTQPEARLSRQIASRLRADGAFVFKVHGSPMMTAGLPDLIVCWRGFYVGLEVKMPDKRDNVSPRQAYVHHQIRKAAGHVEVVCSVAEAVDFVQGVCDE